MLVNAVTYRHRRIFRHFRLKTPGKMSENEEAETNGGAADTTTFTQDESTIRMGLEVTSRFTVEFAQDEAVTSLAGS